MIHTCQIKNIYALFNKEGALNSIQWFKETLFELSYDYYNALYDNYFFDMQEEEEQNFSLPQDPELLSSNIFINNKRAHEKTIKMLEAKIHIPIIESNPKQAHDTLLNILEIGKRQKQNGDILKNEFNSCIDLSIVLSLLAFYYCIKLQLGTIESFNNLHLEISHQCLENLKFHNSYE